MMLRFQEARFIRSANQLDGCPPDSGAEVAFAGRSNAGKSSALNAITGRRGLARTSKTPGLTQLLNFFDLGEDRRLVDLPGYGFARVPPAVQRHWEALMGQYFEHRRTLRGLVVIMDVRRPLMPFDEQMLVYAGAAGLPVHVLLTKADKLSRGAAAAAFRKTRQALDERVGLQLFSALDGRGVEEAREVVAAWLTPAQKSPGAS